jgi:plastocyanin
MARRIIALLLASCFHQAAASPLAVHVTDQDGKPVSEAVVSVMVAGGQNVAASGQPVVMAQERQMFVPRVVAIQRGGSVQFTNRDATQHHVYSFSTPKVFEIPLFGQSEKPAMVFEQAGLVTVGCNIHDSMQAFVVVLDTPHFALTGADGVARIDLQGAGEGELHIWHERLESPFSAETLGSEGLTGRQVRTLRIKAPPPPVRRGLGAWKAP